MKCPEKCDDKNYRKAQLAGHLMLKHKYGFRQANDAVKALEAAEKQ